MQDGKYLLGTAEDKRHNRGSVDPSLLSGVRYHSHDSPGCRPKRTHPRLKSVG